MRRIHSKYPLNLGNHVQIVEYDPSAALDATLAGLIAFQPDIVLLVGTAETITGLMAPLEAGWPVASVRPHYVLTESSKVPELLQLVAADAALGQRVRGIGVRPTSEALPVHQAFVDAYRARFGASGEDVSGMSQSYDAVYALAYAAAVSGNAHSGSQLAVGLRQLSTGTTRMSTGSADRERALAAAADQHALDVTGTLGRLQWNEAGSLQGGMLEGWCVANQGGSAEFRSSGTTYDLGAQTLDGNQAGCPQLQAEFAATLAAGPAPTDPPQVAPPAMQPAAAGRSAADRGQDAGMPAEPSSPPAAPLAQEVGLRVQYRAFNDQARDGTLEPFFRIVNVSAAEAVPLRGLELRYYFTNEQASQCPSACIIDSYYAGISGQTVNARRSVESRSGLTYLSITFERASQLLRRGEYVEIQQQFHTSSYAALDETDDYSFDPSKRDFAESKKVTLYQNDALVWGAPP